MPSGSGRNSSVCQGLLAKTSLGSEPNATADGIWRFGENSVIVVS